MVWWRSSVVLFLALACHLAVAQAASIIPQAHAVLDPAIDRIALWRSLRTIPDAAGTLNPGKVEEQVSAGNAGTLPHANFVYSKWRPYPYWAEFTVKNPSPISQQWLLSYEYPTQDDIRLWIKNDTGSWIQQFEVEQAHARSIGSGTLFPVWRIQLQPQQELRFMLRLDGHNPMRFPLFAVRDDAFVQQQNSLNLGIGFILAIPLVVVLYVLTLIRVADDKSLPLFLAMAACEMVGAVWISGFMHEILPWIDRWSGGWIGSAGYIGMLGLSCQHARIFMNTRERDPLAEGLLNAGTVIWLLIVPVAAWCWPNTSRLVFLSGGALHTFVLTWLAVRGYRRQPSLHMGLFIGVWAVYATSGVSYVLYRLADLPIYITLMSMFIQGAAVAALLGCAVSLQIVRRRHEMQRQLGVEHDRAMLYAAAHHDLWQPIQSIGLYVQSFEEADESQRKKLLKGMNAAMNAISDFMAGWQQLSGKRAPTPKIATVNVDELLGPIVEEYRHLCQTKHIMLRYRPLNIQIQTDVQYLQRIVRNLLSNAMRYTESGGRILVGSRRRDGQHWLVVADTGIGMNPEQAAQCFDAFKRFGDIEKVPEGMGIGLYSVKQMAQALGLRTGLVSSAGKGTVVAVSLGTVASTQGYGIPHISLSVDVQGDSVGQNA